MRVLLHLLARLPLGVLQVLGRFAGWLLWVTNNSRRRVAMTNLSCCLPELDRAQHEKLARASLTHELCTYLETPRVWLGPADAVKNAVREWRGLGIFERALAQGRGVILLSLHMGAFEAVAVPLSARHPMSGLYKPQKGAIPALSVQGRCRFGGRMAVAEAGVRKTALPLLAEGQAVYYMPDHDPPPGGGLFAPFFGVPAHTPSLVAKLIRESGAPVVFLVGERLPRAGGYIAHFFEAPPEIHDPNPKAATAAMNAGLERCVRACPEQYWWGYKRFRRQPPGAPKFYR